MIRELFKNCITELAPGIWEVKGLHQGEYDEQAIQYDKLITNRFYNRIMWGNRTQDYTDFCLKGLTSTGEGVIADIGCGTLGFTYEAYAAHHKNDLYLCDLSYEMLNLGKNRLETIRKDMSGITFLRSDALDMPFKDNTVATVLNFGSFHIFDDPSVLVREIVRILQPKGQLFLTSLCTDRKFSAKYLEFLHKKGHVAEPLSSVKIKTIVENNGIKITDLTVKGGMTYVSGVKPAVDS